MSLANADGGAICRAAVTWRRRLGIGVLAAGMASALGPAAAQDQGQPPPPAQGKITDVEKEEFKAWHLLCGTVTPAPDASGNIGPSRRECSITQLFRNPENRDAVLMAVTIHYLSAQQPPRLIVFLPPLVKEGAPVAGAVDDKQPFGLKAGKCDKNSCRGGTEMSPELIQEMKSGKQMFVFFTVQSDKKVKLPVSLSGFTAAFEALKKKSVPASG